MSAKTLSLFIMGACLSAGATPVPYFSVSGKQLTGDAQGWGVTADTTVGAAFEVVLDLTSDMLTSSTPYTLWSAGGSGTGSDLVLADGNLHFWAGNSTDDVVSGGLGIATPQNNVQIVSVYSLNVSGADDRLQIFVNGTEVATGLVDTSNKWAGSDTSAVGLIAGTATHRYVGTGLFTEGDVADYPNENITFDVYLQNDPNYDLNAILVPEPASLTLVLLGLLGLTARSLRR